MSQIPSAVQPVIEANPAAIAKATEELRGIPKGIGKAISAAVNETNERTRAFAQKGISGALNAPFGKINRTPRGRRRITVIAYGRSRAGKTAGTVSVKDKDIDAINFRPRRGIKGFMVQYLQGGESKNFEGSFKGVGIAAYQRLFQRKAGAPKRYQTKAHYDPNRAKLREPIVGLRGPSPADVIRLEPRIGDWISGFQEAEFPRQLESKCDWLLRRSKQR